MKKNKFEIKKMGNTIHDILSTEELEQRLEMDSMFNLWSLMAPEPEDGACGHCNDCYTNCGNDCGGYVCAAQCGAQCIANCVGLCGDGIY